jgi:hypothetical protein
LGGLTDEAHVECNEQDDWLSEEDAHGAADVAHNELFEIDLDFFLLGVDAPVLRSPPELGRFVDEDDGRIRLFHEEEQQHEGREAHETADIFGPAPAQIALNDEAADKGRKQGSHEDGGGEDGDGESSHLVVEHVCEDGGDDGERRGAEEAGEETTYEDGLEVFGDCYGDAEDGEAERCDDDGRFAAV